MCCLQQRHLAAAHADVCVKPRGCCMGAAGSQLCCRRGCCPALPLPAAPAAHGGGRRHVPGGCCPPSTARWLHCSWLPLHNPGSRWSARRTPVEAPALGWRAAAGRDGPAAECSGVSSRGCPAWAQHAALQRRCMDHARVCQALPSPSAPLLQPFRWPCCSEASEGAHLLRGALHRNHGACGGHGAFHSFSQLCGLTLAQEEEAGSALALVAGLHGKKRPAPVSPDGPPLFRFLVFFVGSRW